MSLQPFDADKQFAGLGFERIHHVHGSTYKDSSTLVMVPMRGLERHADNTACKGGDHRWCKVPAARIEVVQAWRNLIAPMNQKRGWIDVVGHEVGQAYNAMISTVLKDPELSKFRYILTLEDDNVPPPDAHIRLLESIEETGADAVSGIYFTKGDLNMPMAYGDPARYARDGVLEFAPLDVRQFLARGNVVEVNGIAMGCALWRLDLFRQIDPPWFVTVSDLVEGEGVKCFTQDLYFCERARRAGKRFFVDFRVKVGHLDVATGIVY